MDRYIDIIHKVRELKKPEVEKNIFSIGGRGHYENPISDILAFFINPKEEHGFGELFLRSLFESVNKKEQILELIEPPTREQYTDSGKRIDLIVEGENWVFVIENKIRQKFINPFEDYEKYIRGKYGKNKKEIILTLLSIRDEIPPKNWIGVTYTKLISHVKSNIGKYFISASNNKWHVILREFILNIEQEYGETMISKERFDFVKSNYAEIQEINDMLNEYIQHIKLKGLKAINTASEKSDIAFSKQQNWGKLGIALRLLSKDWDDHTNITLLLSRNGSFQVRLYVYNIPDEKVDDLKKVIIHERMNDYWVELNSIRCFGCFDSMAEDETFSEIQNLTNRLDNYFHNERKTGSVPKVMINYNGE